MIVKEGSSGSDVVAIQKALGVHADGSFGPLTKASVIAFQASHGLATDGIVGPLTWAKLFPIASNPATPIHGVDIYHGDNIADWSELVPNGWYFAFIKATEGLHIKDSKFAQYWAAAKAHGVVRGAYHFIHMDQDPIAQATTFVETLNSAGGLEDADLPPVLDFEYLGGQNPKPSDIHIVTDFMDSLKVLTKRKPIIYLSRSVPIEMGSPEVLAQYSLWVASYTSHLSVPSPWGRWDFWQNTDSGHAQGISNPCDCDQFNGSLDDLKAFINTSKL